MCLSNVYTTAPERKLVAKNIALVRFEDGKLLLTDILGRTTRIDAAVERIDLMENEILVRGAEA